ncbi:hypothetical protein BKA65DRAFT_514542 [Rhexocercosporidium sp. MPI-PUGE-AT-0058]|nr:hypothetical protein BKA65DRAFT_514542 [Rhexocercosporidium sp. MPI-PUGE-AT-0058]
MVYGLLKYGKRRVEQFATGDEVFGSIFWGMVGWCSVGHWAFARWWIVKRKEGKFYGGRLVRFICLLLVWHSWD